MMNPTRRGFLELTLALPVAAMVAPGMAGAATHLYFGNGGVAIHGCDPVAYFENAAPVAGKADIALMWKGAEWRFSSVANRSLFEANPKAYAPRYGGYCAYAVSRGYTASTDPEAWTVHEGRLYLNHSLHVRSLWSRDIPGNIARANANWPGVLHG